MKLNRKLCTSIKTRGGDIKSYTPAPGDRMHEGGKQWKATVQSELGRRGVEERREEKQDSYVLRISVVECTMVYKIHNVIQLNHRPKRSENWEQMGLCLCHI